MMHSCSNKHIFQSVGYLVCLVMYEEKFVCRT
jgi:hypothetical protein